LFELNPWAVPQAHGFWRAASCLVIYDTIKILKSLQIIFSFL